MADTAAKGAGSPLRNRPAGDPPVSTAPSPKPPKADSKVETPAGPTAEEHAALAAELAAAREEASLIRVGVTDAEDVEVLRLHYGKLPASTRPKTLAEYFESLKVEGAKVPKSLAHLVTPAEPDTDARPAGTVAGGKKKVEDPIPAAATAEWKKYGEKLGQSERAYFEKVWKPRHAKKT